MRASSLLGSVLLLSLVVACSGSDSGSDLFAGSPTTAGQAGASLAGAAGSVATGGKGAGFGGASTGGKGGGPAGFGGTTGGGKAGTGGALPGGSAGAGGIVGGGGGGTTSGGGKAGAGGNVSAGSAGAGGSGKAGAAGASVGGNGGTSAGTGGTSAGTGGTSAGNGGTSAGNGGTSAGNGGTSAGNGGTSAGAGGATGGTGGAGGAPATCGDGNIDAGEDCDDANPTADDGCTSCKFDGATCAGAIPIGLPDFGTQKLTGTTTTSADVSACQSSGPGRVYAVTPQKTGYMTAYTTRGAFGAAATNFDSVLGVFDACGAQTPIVCNDSYQPSPQAALPGGDVVSVPVEAGVTYYLALTGFGANAKGNYEIVLALASGRDCTDPVVIPIFPGADFDLLGVTTGFGADAKSSCGGTSAEDVVYELRPTAGVDASFTATLSQASFDSLLYSRAVCSFDDAPPRCFNVNGASGEAFTSAYPGAGEKRFVWVDGVTGANGTYTLNIAP